MNAFAKMSLAVAAACGALLIAAPASAHDRHISIQNYAGQSVYRMYVSNSGRGDWGPDQLGRYEVIYSRQRIRWNIDDGTRACYFDFMFVMADGTKRYKYNYNVCREYYLNVID